MSEIQKDTYVASVGYAERHLQW